MALSRRWSPSGFRRTAHPSPAAAVPGALRHGPPGTAAGVLVWLQRRARQPLQCARPVGRADDAGNDGKELVYSLLRLTIDDISFTVDMQLYLRGKFNMASFLVIRYASSFLQQCNNALIGNLVTTDCFGQLTSFLPMCLPKGSVIHIA